MSVAHNNIIETTDESPQLRQARAAADASELRLTWRQVETHHSLFLLKWTAYNYLPEELALWAHQVEVLALAMREALHASTEKHFEDTTKIRKLEQRVVDLITELRQARQIERRAA